MKCLMQFGYTSPLGYTPFMDGKAGSKIAAFLVWCLFSYSVFSLVLPRPAIAESPIQVITSNKGITAWLIEDHSNPMVTVSFMFKHGAASDPKGKAGISTLISGMLDEGAGPYDSQAFQKQLSDHNIHMSFSAGRDSFSGRLRTLKSEQKTAFSLLHLALTQPRFDTAPLSRMRGVFLAQLHQRPESPMARAADTMLATLFDGHPYAVPTSGTKQGLKAITADDLRAYIKNRFVKNKLAVSVVGDITPMELKASLDQIFSKLPEQSNLPPVTDTKPKLDGAIHSQNMPIPQATALFVQDGPSRNEHDWHGYQVMMYILGAGGFSSRLTEEVREKRGLAYSISASSAPFFHAPLTIGTVASKNTRIKESLALIPKEWVRMRETGPTDAEIQKAKEYLIGSLPLRFNSSHAIASSLTSLQFYGLPQNDLNRRAEIIRNLKASDIRSIAKRWLKPEKLTVFLVGDLDQMDRPIKAK